MNQQGCSQESIDYFVSPVIGARMPSLDDVSDYQLVASPENHQNAQGTMPGMPSPKAPSIKNPKTKNPKQNTPKIEKDYEIRTKRNVQKTYHLILKHWLQREKCTDILAKYEKYFNQRVYFILVLDEITKHIDGQIFKQQYEELTQEVIQKKKKEIYHLEQQKQNSYHAQHLREVIQEIQYSIKACHEFAAGNVLDALSIVYRRDQKNIVKVKTFQSAIDTYRDITGNYPENF